MGRERAYHALTTNPWVSIPLKTGKPKNLLDKRTINIYNINRKNDNINTNKHMTSPAQRQHYILEQIELRGSVLVFELAKALVVSDMTIRRDLKELEKVGLIRRTHGGAVNARGRSYEPPLTVRSDENRSVKQMIGRYAAGMVSEGDSISLDIGSTTYEVAVHLDKISNITLITPSIPIASLFFNRSDVRLILPGGIIRPGETSMIGNLARNNLELLYVDRLFLGVGALDSTAQLTEYNLDDAYIKQLMIKNAKEVVVVADSSKFERIAFSHVASFAAIHHLITNHEPPQRLKNALKDNNVIIHVVGSNEAVLI